MLRFCASSDNLATADLQQMYNMVDGSWSIKSSGGIHGTGSLNIDDLVATSGVDIALDNQPTWVVGFGFKLSGTRGPLLGRRTFLMFHDGETTQCYLRSNLDSTLTFFRGNGTAIVTSTKPVPMNNYFYIEVKVTVHSASGAVEVRVNGEVYMTATGVNTQTSGNNYANTITFGTLTDAASVVNDACDYDDVYICDTNGANNNDFLGFVRVEHIGPSGAGGASEWVPVGVGTNYQAVDDATPNDETDYVLGSVVGKRDLYQFGDVSIPSGQQNAVLAVQTNVYWRKDFAGSRTIRPVIASANGTALGTPLYHASKYYYDRQIFETNPTSGTAWGISGVNNAQFGFEVAS